MIARLFSERDWVIVELELGFRILYLLVEYDREVIDANKIRLTVEISAPLARQRYPDDYTRKG